MINVDTKLIALLGTPLRQSFSTKMQNAAFKKYNLDYEYFPIETGPDNLGAIISAIRHMNFAGFAVTKPDKVEVIPYLDELDDLALKIGAVNTVVNDNGHLKGYNTDGEGCFRSLKENMNCSMDAAAFVCLGAGGSARAVCATLAARGAKKIYITDKFDQYSRQLVTQINEKIAPVAEQLPLADKEALNEAVRHSQVIMNHTGIGMGSHMNESPVSDDLFHGGLLAFDAIYNPHKSMFLKQAEAKNCKIVNGLGMLVYQGAIQFRLWTGLEEPAELMYAKVREILAES